MVCHYPVPMSSHGSPCSDSSNCPGETFTLSSVGSEGDKQDLTNAFCGVRSTPGAVVQMQAFVFPVLNWMSQIPCYVALAVICSLFCHFSFSYHELEQCTE